MAGLRARDLRTPGPRATLAVAGAIVAALVVVVAVLAFRLGGASDAAASATHTPKPTPSPTAPTVAQLYRLVGPSVVIVQTSTGELGTGIVATSDGTIITANHVISGGGTIEVAFSDGTETQASVISSDLTTDIAALAPAQLPQPLVPATLGGDTTVGAPVVAIGNPLGLSYSVSSGVVAGTDRKADTDAGEFSGLIQFDASVNPGSSGGPLLDGSGDVIGIVVSIADPGHDGAWAGVGFAVPIGAALGGTGTGEPAPQL
ncbi:S1C family serine protease [Gryllotalpicola protaetiae]|uniref:Serine protease n=1 Tax=Gryllotalpicola protaetiae TaxID=2419771 RepID=A0A387BUF7_9MICO|nr:trypsin-like peptidase domain-containing protein [Gryllotalpicola protaetiae]AYG04686.1 serine protease [Gryllotalpicola protaetiae]